MDTMRVIATTRATTVREHNYIVGLARATRFLARRALDRLACAAVTSSCAASSMKWASTSTRAFVFARRCALGVTGTVCTYKHRSSRTGPGLTMDTLQAIAMRCHPPLSSRVRRWPWPADTYPTEQQATDRRYVSNGAAGHGPRRHRQGRDYNIGHAAIARERSGCRE